MHEKTEPNFAGGEILAGKYRVERVIGQGGMGIVLAAKHEALNTNVAIKLLREQALDHTEVMGRFMREARAAVSLRSEHVARVFDVGTLEDGRPYIVMERLEGKDLGDVIEQGPILSIPEAVDYVLQACEAIAEAHRAGIVHRDLKPKNLFLTHAVHGRPLVKVLDFGISKVDPNQPGEMQLTRTTEVIGSPSYMSPEQLRSARNVDARTDIWALGVILYELLTRRVPFYAETVTELVLVVVTEREPPVRSLRPEVPEALEQVIARCLQKAPEHRFQSVLELVQALEPFTSGIQATATERIRGVVGATTPIPSPMTAPMAAPIAPGAPGSSPGSHGAGVAYPSGAPSNPSAPPAAASSRVNVHGGTSVAWGETQSQVSPPHTRPAQGRSGLLAALGITALFVAGGAVGGAVWYVKHANAAAQQAPPPVAASDPSGGVPLPPGRKDLPPINSAPVTVTSATPDPPAATTLPDVRKPPAPPTVATPTAAAPPIPPAGRPNAPAAPKPKPSDKPDDLSNIGRR